MNPNLLPAIERSDVHLEDALIHGTGFGSLEAQVEREANDLLARFGPLLALRLAVLIFSRARHHNDRFARAAHRAMAIRASMTMLPATGRHARHAWIRSPRQPKHAR